jgi:vomeronasal1 receptor
MPSENFAMGIFFFCHIIVGMVVNSSLLFYYVILIFTEKHLMPRDIIKELLIFCQLLVYHLKRHPMDNVIFVI